MHNSFVAEQEMAFSVNAVQKRIVAHNASHKKIAAMARFPNDDYQ
jgi:hypothetical protein